MEVPYTSLDFLSETIPQNLWPQNVIDHVVARQKLGPIMMRIPQGQEMKNIQQAALLALL